MTEQSRNSDESLVDRDEDDNVREQIGITETLLLDDNNSEASKNLPYLLVLTCGGAG